MARAQILAILKSALYTAFIQALFPLYSTCTEHMCKDAWVSIGVITIFPQNQTLMKKLPNVSKGERGRGREKERKRGGRGGGEGKQENKGLYL
jgi:hypothetical protein